MTSKALWFAAAALIPAHAALAQTAAPPAANPATPARPGATTGAATSPPRGAARDPTVTVTGTPPAYRSSIDRRSYSVAGDLQTTNGSLADALRNIPSVQVDVQGNISLRGDANVTILVDGKPSALFQGQNRADALQQLPATQIDRVEVMTNPSAAFRPDGSAGIINLISKKGSRNPGVTGSIRANVGTGGRYNAGLSGAYSAKPLTLSGNAGFRHDTFQFNGTTTTDLLDPASGTLIQTRAQTQSKGSSTSGYARVAADYDLDSKTRLSGDLTRFQADFASPFTGTYRSAAASGPLAQDYNIAGRFHGRFSGTSSSATYLRKLAGEEHEFSVRVSLDANAGEQQNFQIYNYLRPSRPNLYQSLSSHSEQQNTELKAEYKSPAPGQAKLVAGYELRLEHSRFDNQGELGVSAATAAVSPGLTNLFKFDQTVNALYATYEKPFGKFTVLPGLRLEEVDLETDQVTSRLQDNYSYFRAYPTLHTAFKLNSQQQITGSYSRRVQRPNPQDLNPYRIYQSPLSYRQGNSRLAPQITDSFELGYEFRQRATYYLATLYYRDNRQGVTDVVSDLGNGVLLTTRANLGQSRNGGLELVANGRVTPKISYNVSSNLFYSQIDASNLGFTQQRSGASISGRANLNWEPTTKDFLQLNAFATGKTLTPQGYRAPTLMLNLGYRHKYNDKISFVATAQDPFNTFKQRTVVDTPILKQHTDNDIRIRSLFVGFTYALGAPNRRRPETFDYGGGAPGAGVPTP